MVYRLILLRHGQSQWNAKNLFTGWVDVPLSEIGQEEAKKAGLLLRKENALPDVVHTSMLRRAIMTANLALDVADRHWIEVKRSWRLNERHYGALQGKDKKAIRAEYGDQQFMSWRRSYDVPPPPIDPMDKCAQNNDLRYKDEPVPLSERLSDVFDRLLPYWHDAICPDLRSGKTVLVAAHGNSLRAIIKHLDNVSDEDIVSVNVPTGIPLLYELDDDLKPIIRGGKYLDPEAADIAMEKVANQGK